MKAERIDTKHMDIDNFFVHEWFFGSIDLLGAYILGYYTMNYCQIWLINVFSNKFNGNVLIYKWPIIIVYVSVSVSVFVRAFHFWLDNIADVMISMTQYGREASFNVWCEWNKCNERDFPHQIGSNHLRDVR